ncbi:MAG: redoxin domain-containing protein [Planctomycetales bacterium]|nr:redoxin domain-containing protein [Planctomycetales bacterium]NIM07912.1 redoxin domain-containing protein [Planctomycetales bacterium]NIN07399.1 redoxin domain-containing protein [Planctomycetales bacterium]NIN76503.1 redoxin domain-containing protein [Planctomycetales bacterium]NIO33693.1 redoxin domain-containing protein [Planctomycetales bacterium]
MRSILTFCILLTPWAVHADPILPLSNDALPPRLKSIYSELHSLDELADPGRPATVWIFLGIDCPVAQQYAPTLKNLYDKYRKQGVQFYGVYPNARVDLLKMARHAHDHELPFPVFLDAEHRLADLLSVEVTPEVVVLDAAWEKRYQGAIDNQFRKRGRLREASQNYLADALDRLLAGEPVGQPYRAPSGCPLERRPPPPPRQNLTFHRDVAVLIQQNCEVCHREGGVAPFELVTFDDVYYSAERVRETVEERRMPPWHGFLNPRYGELVNDKSLSEEQIRTIVDWVRQGAPEGNPAEAPPPVDWPDPQAWEIGEPDFVYKTPPFTVPKHGVLDYQFFRVPLNLDRDRWFRGVEVKPGDVEVVHHVGLHVVPASDKKFTGFLGMAELYGFNTEGAILINDYVPGDTYNAKVYPPDQAVKIPAGSDLVFELHYTPNNREPRVDQSMVAFQWAATVPDDEVLTKVFRKPVGRFRIPPHEHHYRMVDNYYFEHDVWIDAIRPHFHLRAKSFRLEIVHRDEDTDEVVSRETLLSVPIWDPDWQRTYELKTPLRLLAGTELVATGIFDNTALNPNNPDPNVMVFWGQQTADEMFSVRFKYRVVKP